MTPEDLVRIEVGHCVSSLVDHFAQRPESLNGSDYDWEDDVWPLLVKDDWEETAHDWVRAATAAELRETCEALGVEPVRLVDAENRRSALWHHIYRSQEASRELCEMHNLDPYQIEALEHWIVSDWLAKQLAKRGEMVGELLGLTIWGRACSGQGIACDWVIQDIADCVTNS